MLVLGGISALGDTVGGAVADIAGDAAGDAFGAADDAASVTQNLLDTLAPDGELIGEAGSDPSIRELPGGSDAAEQIFQDLTDGGTPYAKPYNGTGFTMPDGSFIGYRANSVSGPPTIDLNIPYLGEALTKLKFPN